MGEFKRITVKAADEEDEVIVAGLGAIAQDVAGADGAELPDAGAGGAESGDAAADAAPDGASDAADPQPARDDATAAPGAADEVAQTVPMAKPAAKPASTSKKRTAADYRPTTLEDLESSKMPTAQKVVIALALICIIGALVFYFTVMR